MVSLEKIMPNFSAQREGLGKLWQSAKGPLKDTNIGKQNVGKLLTKMNKNLDGFIANQGEKKVAKIMGEKSILLTKKDLANVGSKTISGRFANLGKKLIGKIGTVSRGIPGAALVLSSLGEIGNVVQGFKEGRGLAQIADSACKVTGITVGSAVGAGAAALALGLIASNPVGWVVGGVGLIGAIAGASYGGKIGDKIGDIPAGLIEGLGLSAKKTEEVTTHKVFSSEQQAQKQMTDEQLRIAIFQQLLARNNNPFAALQLNQERYSQEQMTDEQCRMAIIRQLRAKHNDLAFVNPFVAM